MDNEILKSNDKQLLTKTARAMGITIPHSLGIDDIKKRIADKLGNLGWNQLDETDAEPEAKDRAVEGAIETLTRSEFAGASYPTRLPRAGVLPNLLPFMNPWGGKRMRIKRVRRENDQKILFIHWNGYPFVLGIDAEYADVPMPHYNNLMNTRGQKLEQKRVKDETSGLTIWDNVWHEHEYMPIQSLGVSPGTEHLPESLKHYIYQMYVEGFPGFNNRMWSQITRNGYNYKDYSNKPGEEHLNIRVGMALEEQIRVRRQTILDRLNIADDGKDDASLSDSDKEVRRTIINELVRGTALAA